MKRWLILIFAFLVVGTIINVAVASWFALTTRPMPVQDFRNLTADEARALWDRWGPRPWDEVHRPGGMLQLAKGRDVLLVMADAEPWPDRKTESTKVIDSFGIGEYSYGWPRRSLGLVHVHDTTQTGPARNRVLGGLPVSDQQPDLGASVVGAIPLRPIWGGFVYNTVLFTIALTIAFVIPILLIRYRRFRLGRCVGCGYPSGVSEVCTECGRTSRSKSPSTERD